MQARDQLRAGALAASRGEHSEAIRLFEAALSSGRGTIDEAEQIRALCSLSASCRLDGRWGAAEQHAQAAVDRAEQVGDALLVGRAKLELGTLMFCIFEARAASSEPDPFSKALAAVDEAAGAYERAGSIQLYSCLLTLGRLLEAAELEEEACSTWARITRELTEERWANSTELAHLADYFRGRAFFELARIQLGKTDQSNALDYFEAAAGLIRASKSPDAETVVALIAGHLRDDLGRPDAATRLLEGTP